ncbi:hypothetical protein FA95DRAFT_1680946 [Auriscalpium vulgare]|uniref:Uncharacterized protein n=1 Tax=Auriscalpium vulgare TaxID=40419 RepID=A0ACB8RMC8_9AGAM|nr:hypothetical protein FA95DRAFT_1680946 [Auriscalpium vulgare]
MISFAGLSPEVAEAMCTPMHLILPPAPVSPPLSPSTRSPVSTAGALYLGSLSAVLDSSILKDHRIHHLVQVLDVPWLPASENDGYQCYRMDILDIESQDLKPHLEDAVEYIDGALRRGQNVLVHCQQGVSRSAAIVIAYLIRKRGMSYDAATAYVHKRRPCIKPNSGFVRCLKDWEHQWRPRPTRAQTSRSIHETLRCYDVRVVWALCVMAGASIRGCGDPLGFLFGAGGYSPAVDSDGQRLPPTSSMGTSNVAGNDVGALPVGVILAGAICGVTTQQVIYYFDRFRHRDGPLVKAYVFTIWIITLLALALDTYSVYYYFVIRYGDRTVFFQTVWALCLESISTAILVCAVQLFLVYRTWQRMRSHPSHTPVLKSSSAPRRLPPLPTDELDLPLSYHPLRIYTVKRHGARHYGVRLASSFLVSSRNSHPRRWKNKSWDASFQANHALYIANGTVQVALSIFMVGALVHLLNLHRNEFARRENIIARLTMFFITRGFALALTQLVVFIVPLAAPRSYAFVAVKMLLSGVYANTLLVMLNNRLERGRGSSARSEPFTLPHFTVPELHASASTSTIPDTPENSGPQKPSKDSSLMRVAGLESEDDPDGHSIRDRFPAEGSGRSKKRPAGVGL